MKAAARQHEPRGDLVVVAPGMIVSAFRIAGPRVMRADDARQVQAVVTDELVGAAAEGGATGPAIVAVHRALWDLVPEPVRRGWEQQLRPLIVPLPADTGRIGVGRREALRDLLARSVGYEITFATEGESS